MEDSEIISRPDLLGGKPCIRNTRLSVELLLELLASGKTERQILDVYPHLTEQSLRAATRYAESHQDEPPQLC